MPKKGSADYDDYREGQARISREKSEAGREIGAIPAITSVRRRARCRSSLRHFCEVYNPEAFPIAWSDEHLRAMTRLEEAAVHGSLYAFAMPRGSGKTTLCRMAALWAISYGLRRYVFAVGANAGKAADTLDAIRVYMRFLPLYGEDFPEIAYPIKKIGGIANRSAGQTCGGKPTMVEWCKERIVLPTVPPPPNWPKSWKLRDDGMVPTSGAVVSASGLTGDGLRGSLLTLTTGEAIRPDLVLLDDPQTHESAHSPTQNATREQLVSADVLGMAGPGKTISAVMPCTVIAPGDFVDRILDRTRHPLWRGERTKLLRSMPTNMDAWQAYFDVYSECALKEPPDYSAANAHYEAHRAELEAGAVASWPERKLPGEVSALQHAMHLYFRDVRAFMAEYQNDPMAVGPESSVVELTADEVAAKLCALPRGSVPRDATRVTLGVDVHGNCHYWLLAAWQEDYGGAVVDYGVWPRQNRAYFSKSDARPALADVFPDMAESGRIYAGLGALLDEVLGREWAREGGGPVARVERVLIDGNWGESTDTVYQFCRQSRHSAILLPSHGRGIVASMLPIRDWTRRPGERRGRDWVIPPPAQGRGRHVTFDSNAWKTFAHERLRTPGGCPGCLWLPGDRPHDHQLLADHITSEYRVRTAGRGREVDEWKERPGSPDNHWLDCLVLATLAASVQGLVWSSAGAAGAPVAPRPTGGKPAKWSDTYRERRGEK